ncbi:hypothetical protein GCM10023189_41000 [Nibrella saemangeumensis]|uniref:Cyclodipeptide synthase n=2 Tax=Nibrella saemangeumensis TaxID=1084526 RepID=A0ABP8NCZ0_9BACT
MGQVSASFKPIRPDSFHNSDVEPAYFNIPDLTLPSADYFYYDHYGSEGLEGRFSILPLSHSRALRTGLDLLSQQPLVLFGISPGNAFFTRKRIEIAVCGMAQLFGEVAIVVPGPISAHTYRALGYGEEKVATKVRTEGQNIRNRCLRAMERAQIENPLAKLRILDWERDIESLPGYWDAYADVCRLFNTNEQFQKAVLDKGYSVLSAKLSEDTITPTAVRECVEYLLKEFAYLMLCRAASGKDLVIPYHQDFALGQGFCDGEYQDPLPGIGWLIFKIELVGESSVLDYGAKDLMVGPA